MIKKEEVSKLLMKAFLQRLNEKNGGSIGCGKCTGGTFSELPETKTNLQQVKMVQEPTVLTGSGVKKQNPWMTHVAKVKSENPGIKYSEVLKKAKGSYTKTGGGVVIPKTSNVKKNKTSADYETKLENPIIAQDEVWNKFNQSKKIKVPKTSALDQKSSIGTKPKVTIVVPEKKTKTLKMTKPKKEPLGVQSKVELKIRTKRRPKSFAKELAKELGRSDVDEKLAEYEKFGPAREGADIGSTDYGESSKPLFGSGMKGFEKELFKYIEKETKDLTQSKKISFAKKYITEKLKEKGWKPFEIKAVINIAISRMDKKGGATTVKLPPNQIETILMTLEKVGVFDASKKTLNSLADKLADVVNDPKKYQKQRILTRTIPDLQFAYEQLKNVWDIKHTGWTQFRQNNHKIRMMNIKSNITRQINQLVGINSLSPKPV